MMYADKGVYELNERNAGMRLDTRDLAKSSHVREARPKTHITNPTELQVDHFDRVITDQVVPSYRPDDVLKSLVVPL